MIRIPLPTPLLAAITAAFSFLFSWHLEQKNFLLGLIGVACFVWCLAELVQRLVERFRDRRKP